MKVFHIQLLRVSLLHVPYVYLPRHRHLSDCKGYGLRYRNLQLLANSGSTSLDRSLQSRVTLDELGGWEVFVNDIGIG